MFQSKPVNTRFTARAVEKYSSVYWKLSTQLNGFLDKIKKNLAPFRKNLFV